MKKFLGSIQKFASSKRQSVGVKKQKMRLPAEGFRASFHHASSKETMRTMIVNLDLDLVDDSSLTWSLPAQRKSISPILTSAPFHIQDIDPYYWIEPNHDDKVGSMSPHRYDCVSEEHDHQDHQSLSEAPSIISEITTSETQEHMRSSQYAAPSIRILNEYERMRRCPAADDTNPEKPLQLQLLGLDPNEEARRGAYRSRRGSTAELIPIPRPKSDWNGPLCQFETIAAALVEFQ